MAYHALLDWRLARDLYAVLGGSALVVDTAAEAAAIGRWSSAFGGKVLAGAPAATTRYSNPKHGDFAVIGKHPLEASENTLIAPRLADAQAAAEARLPGIDGVIFVDTFTLDRDPRRVLEMCEEVERMR
jgi:hypothetical protein